MRTLVALLILSATGLCAAADAEAPTVPPRSGKTEIIKLFDGKTLDGWQGYSDLWSAKDGVIVAKNTEPLKYSTYLLTEDEYTDFRLTFSAKLVESDRMNGLAVYSVVGPEKPYPCPLLEVRKPSD